MIMKRWTILFLMLGVACVPVRVVNVSKLSPIANGAAYKTYNFGDLDIKNEPFGNYQKNLRFLTSAIDREMQAKGFQRAATNPDLLINLGLAITDEVQTRETTIRDAPYNVRYSATGTYGRSYSYQNTEIEVARYKEGHVAFDLVDVKKSELIWQGSVARLL